MACRVRPRGAQESSRGSSCTVTWRTGCVAWRVARSRFRMRVLLYYRCWCLVVIVLCHSTSSSTLAIVPVLASIFTSSANMFPHSPALLGCVQTSRVGGVI